MTFLDLWADYNTEIFSMNNVPSNMRMIEYYEVPKVGSKARPVCFEASD